jgi:hypothetical protein
MLYLPKVFLDIFSFILYWMVEMSRVVSGTKEQHLSLSSMDVVQGDYRINGIYT